MNTQNRTLTPSKAPTASVRIARAAALLAVLVLAVSLVGGCASKPNSILVHDLYFDPPTLTVPVGTTVTWTFADQTAHIIQTDNFGVAGVSQVGQFTTDPFNPGQSFTHTFATPGTFTYSDPLQSYMTGTIVVK